jgi:hypothetical protein
MTEHTLPANSSKESSTPGNIQFEVGEWSAPMTLILALVVVGLPLLAWLADLAMVDMARTLARIEAIILDAEEQP